MNVDVVNIRFVFFIVHKQRTYRQETIGKASVTILEL